MIQKLSTPVSVVLNFDHRRRLAAPELVVWEGRDYPVVKVGFHHSFRQGRTLYHVFSVVSQSVFFRLVLNTDNLFWTLEEVSDGEVA
ncbi:MAG TPA: hypothetical protein VF828_01495 [Patescibacteria group bacterium]